MKKIELGIHGGGRLEVYGSLAAKQILIILSRENFQLDDPLVARLIRFFAETNRTVVRYEARAVVTIRLIDRKSFRLLPQPIRQGLKALLLLFIPTRWRHFSPGYRAEASSIAYRAQSLRELIEFLGPEKDISLLTRSSSGWVASLIAAQAKVRKLVCIGYPFKHPDHAPEPERYAHLEGLETPFLIIQGTQDAYGGREIRDNYKFARNTTIQWVETDHDFAIPDQEWDRVLGLMNDFISRD